MTDKITPLQALADTMAEPAQIESMLTVRANNKRSSLLSEMMSRHVASNEIRSDLETMLSGRCFSRFNKKKMLDRVVAKAMRGYETLLRTEVHKQISRAHATGNNRLAEELSKTLSSGRIGNYRTGRYCRRSK